MLGFTYTEIFWVFSSEGLNRRAMTEQNLRDAKLKAGHEYYMCLARAKAIRGAKCQFPSFPLNLKPPEFN
jgi:hypothetical protein